MVLFVKQVHLQKEVGALVDGGVSGMFSEGGRGVGGRTGCRCESEEGGEGEDEDGGVHGAFVAGFLGEEGR